jgi:hypothetical protein
MKAFGTTLRTSTRPAAWACSETGGGSAEAIGTLVTAATTAAMTAHAHLPAANTRLSVQHLNVGGHASVALRVTAGRPGWPGRWWSDIRSIRSSCQLRRHLRRCAQTTYSQRPANARSFGDADDYLLLTQTILLFGSGCRKVAKLALIYLKIKVDVVLRNLRR